MSRAASASPHAASKARGRRAVTPTVRPGVVPFTPSSGRAVTPTTRPAPVPATPFVGPPPPSPQPPPRRFGHLDAVLSDMRAAVDGALNRRLPRAIIADSTGLRPAFFRRSSSATPDATATRVARRAPPTTAAQQSPDRLAFRGVQMHARRQSQSAGDRSAPSASPALEPEQRIQEERGGREACGGKHCTCHGTAASAARQAQSRRRPLSAPRLDVNARLAILAAALPTLGCEGAVAAAAAALGNGQQASAEPNTGGDPHSGAARLRWADNLRRYAWRRVCARCAGSGEVMGVGRTLLHPTAVPTRGAEYWGCGSSSEHMLSSSTTEAEQAAVTAAATEVEEACRNQTTCPQCGDLFGHEAAAVATPLAGSTAGIRGRSSGKVGIIGALRSLSAERRTMEHGGKGSNEDAGAPQPGVAEESASAICVTAMASASTVARSAEAVQCGETQDQGAVLALRDATAPSEPFRRGDETVVQSIASSVSLKQDAVSGVSPELVPATSPDAPIVAPVPPPLQLQAVFSPKLTETELASQAPASLVTELSAGAPNTSVREASGPPAVVAAVATASTTQAAPTVSAALPAESLAAAQQTPPAPVIAAAPVELSRSHSSPDDSKNTSGALGGDSHMHDGTLSFAEEVALAATAAVRKAIHLRQSPHVAHQRNAVSRVSSRRQQHVLIDDDASLLSDETPLTSSTASSVQEAVVAAIKARLRALRQASGGSIDLAGVRDRVLDALYKQRLAVEQRRGQRAAEAREQERRAAQLAARIVGERVRAESAARERLRQESGGGRSSRAGRRRSVASEDDDSDDSGSSDDSRDRRRRRYVASELSRIAAASHPPASLAHRAESRGRKDERVTAQDQRDGRGASSLQSRVSATPANSPERNASRQQYRRTNNARESTASSATSDSEGRASGGDDAESGHDSYYSRVHYRSTDAKEVRARSRSAEAGSRRSRQGNAPAPAPPPVRSGSDHRFRPAHSAGRATRRDTPPAGDIDEVQRPLGSSLFLSGPSSELSQQTRTPLFHNVSHVLHARREMVAGAAPGGRESVFAPSEAEVSGPEQLAARARTLGFVAGNMFGASASSDSAPLPLQPRGTADAGGDSGGACAPPLRPPLAGLRHAASANELADSRRRSSSSGGGAGGLSFIGALGASIPRHELPHTPGWDPRASGSDNAAKQLRAALGVLPPPPAGHWQAGTSSPVGPCPPQHVPFPRGLLLPSTAAHPHVSLHTLAEREHDVMSRWPATMAAAAEMQLRALRPELLHAQGGSGHTAGFQR